MYLFDLKFRQIFIPIISTSRNVNEYEFQTIYIKLRKIVLCYTSKVHYTYRYLYNILTKRVFQSNLFFADGSSLELAGKDPGVPSTSTTGPTLVAPSHEPRMEAAPHGPMDDGFGGTIGDVADFGRMYRYRSHIYLKQLKSMTTTISRSQ